MDVLRAGINSVLWVAYFKVSKCKTTQKVVFHPNQRPGLLVLVMSVEELAYVFPETWVDDFVISVFQGMWHDFFQPHPRSIKDLCACQFGFAFDFACLCPF